MKELFDEHLELLKSEHQYRELKEFQGINEKYIQHKGKEYLNLVSNNYLGLAQHPRLKNAAQKSIEKWGVGSTGSRLLGGTHSPHLSLEKRLATYHSMERALLFNTGYMANLGVIRTLSDFADNILSDKLNHASVMDAIRYNNIPFNRYRHADMDHLEANLLNEKKLKRTFVISETLFSMDGDFVNLKRLSQLQKKYGFFLLLDQAHSFGGYPRIKADLQLFNKEKTLIMGTLGKAIGSFGAFVVGSESAIEILINRSRPFIFSTGLPAFVADTCLESLKIIEEEPQRIKRLHEVIQKFKRLLKEQQIECSNSDSHIFPIIIGTNKKALAIADAMKEKGFFVQAVRHPTVPKGTARLRLSLHSELDFNDLKQVSQALKASLSEYNTLSQKYSL